MPNVALLLKKLTSPNTIKKEKEILRHTLNDIDDILISSGLPSVRKSENIDDDLFNTIQSRYKVNDTGAKPYNKNEKDATNFLLEHGYDEFGEKIVDNSQDLDKKVDDIVELFENDYTNNENLVNNSPVINRFVEYLEDKDIVDKANDYFNNRTDENFLRYKNEIENYYEPLKESMTKAAYVYKTSKPAKDFVNSIGAYKQKRPKYGFNMRRTNMDEPHINSEVDGYFDEDLFDAYDYKPGQALNEQERSYIQSEIMKPNAYKKDPKYVDYLLRLLEGS